MLVQNLAEIAEPLREFHLRGFVERLAAEQNHAVAMPDVADGFDGGGGKIVAQVDAHDLGADARRERTRLDER